MNSIKNAMGAVYTLVLVDKKNKPKARLLVKEFAIKSTCTFMDLYTKNSLNIVPVLAVDFSLANLTFDDMA